MPSSPNKNIGNMMQWTVAHQYNWVLRSQYGKITWDDYLEKECARFKSHGRVAEVKNVGTGKVKVLCLYVNRVA